MNKEEILKKVEDEIKEYSEISEMFTNVPNSETKKDCDECVEALQGLLDLYNKEKEENNKLKEIIFNIRHKLKGKIINKNDKTYSPAKNLSKQEVYQTFVDINIYLKANYIFKDDETAIQELLKGE